MVDKLAARGLLHDLRYSESSREGEETVALPPSYEEGRHATYDAAGLIGAFGDKTLNEPPSILIRLRCAGLFLPLQQLLECHPRAGGSPPSIFSVYTRCVWRRHPAETKNS